MRLELKKYELHPAGLFEFTIVKIVEDELGYGPVFKIGLKSPLGETIVVCSQSYSDKSKFGTIVNAVFGKMPEDLETDSLVGCKLQGLVEHIEKDGRKFDKVEKFLPCGQQHDPFKDV